MVHPDFLVLLNFNLDLTSSLILKVRVLTFMVKQFLFAPLFTMVVDHSSLLVLVQRLLDLIHSPTQEHSPLVVNQSLRLISESLVVVKSSDSAVVQNLQQLMHQKVPFFSYLLDLQIQIVHAHMKELELNLFLVNQKIFVQEHLPEKVHSSVQEVQQKLQQFPNQKALFYSRLLEEKQMHSSDLLLLKVMLLSVIIWMKHSQDLMLAKVHSSDLMVLPKR